MHLYVTYLFKQGGKISPSLLVESLGDFNLFRFTIYLPPRYQLYNSVVKLMTWSIAALKLSYVTLDKSVGRL